LFGLKPCCGAGLVLIGLGVAGWGDSMETHRQLLVNPLAVGIGQHVTRVAVHPGEFSDLDRDASFLGDFAYHRG
jgi:hypothetical protein